MSADYRSLKLLSDANARLQEIVRKQSRIILQLRATQWVALAWFIAGSVMMFIGITQGFR